MKWKQAAAQCELWSCQWVSAAQAHRRPPSSTSYTLRPLLFFPWDSSGKGLEITVPHPHGEPVQGLITPENIPFPDKATTPAGEAAVVTAAWQSMLHTRSRSLSHTHTLTHTHTHTHTHTLSLFLFLPLCSALLQPPRKGSEEMEREREKRKPAQQSLQYLPSVSLFSPPSLPPSLAPVSGMSWPCARGPPAPSRIPSAKPIDPLTTCCSASFREVQACTCTISIHTGLQHNMGISVDRSSFPLISSPYILQPSSIITTWGCRCPIRLFLLLLLRAHPLSVTVCMSASHEISNRTANS